MAREELALALDEVELAFKLKTLVSRYDEMQFTGSPETLRSKFLLLVVRACRWNQRKELVQDRARVAVLLA